MKNTAAERENLELRADLQRALNKIRALVIESGNSAVISDYTLAVAYGKELIESRDESKRVYMLAVR